MRRLIFDIAHSQFCWGRFWQVRSEEVEEEDLSALVIEKAPKPGGATDSQFLSKKMQETNSTNK
jgi:hypothetical protein